MTLTGAGLSIAAAGRLQGPGVGRQRHHGHPPGAPRPRRDRTLRAPSRAQADVVEYLGNEELIHVSAGGADIVAVIGSEYRVRPGDALDAPGAAGQDPPVRRRDRALPAPVRPGGRRGHGRRAGHRAGRGTRPGLTARPDRPDSPSLKRPGGAVPPGRSLCRGPSDRLACHDLATWLSSATGPRRAVRTATTTPPPRPCRPPRRPGPSAPPMPRMAPSSPTSWPACSDSSHLTSM